MAFVSHGFFVTFELVDKSEHTTRRTYQVNAATYADAVTAVTTFRGYLEAMTDATITTQSISERYANDAAQLPTATRPITENATLTLRINNNPLKKASTSVPMPKDGIFVAASGEGFDIVDPADAAVIAFWGAFTPNGEMYISDGETVDEIAGLVAGRRTGRSFSG